MVTQDYKVFIGNIPYDCRENDIHHFFRGFGRIKEVKLKVFKTICVDKVDSIRLFSRTITAFVSS